VITAFVLVLAMDAAPDRAARLAAAARFAEVHQTAAAIAAYRDVLASTRPDDPERPAVLLALALQELEAGDYDGSLRHATEAAETYRRAGNVSRRGVALNLAGRAQIYAGDYPSAERTLLAAIEDLNTPGLEVNVAEATSNLGNVYLFRGRYADALDQYERALRLTEQHPDAPGAARRKRLVQVNRATVFQRLARYEQALEIYQQLGAAADTLPKQEHAQILTNLGTLYRRLGDPRKALEAYDQALALFAQDELSAGELNVRKNRGIVLALELGELEAARRTFSDSLARATAAGNGRETVQAQLYRGETERLAGLMDAARADFEASLEAARALRTPEDEWKALFGLGRIDLASGRHAEAAAHLERAVGVIERIREALRVPTLRSDFFTDKREVYDALIAASIDSATPARLFNLIERSHSRAWRERLGLSGSVELTSIQQTLAADTALVDFWQSSMGSAAVLVTRDRADVIRVRVHSGAIERLISSLADGPSSTSTAGAAEIAAGLGLDLPPSTRHVIVVPDGMFALVPFEMLPVGGQLLVAQAAVSYAPTAALLLRAPPEHPRFIAPWRLQLRAFADPSFEAARLDDAGRLRGTLAASAEEVRGVASELAGQASLHVGADDRKAYLNDPSAAPILHIATHAVADANAMEQSRILFAPARQDAREADYLFLNEAYGLKLQGVELAVLSACDTERGQLLRGEGVQSFSRAFLAAGALSTVTTLWRVPDAPTADLMKIFYHHLQRGEPRDEALRLAKLRFLQSGSGLSDPHYWAAFVLTGDGVRPIPRATSWITIGLWVGVAVALIIAVYVAARAPGPARRARRWGRGGSGRPAGGAPRPSGRCCGPRQRFGRRC